MDIKIVCGCGQKYIFEVNPDEGLMPGTVICPSCGSDGTQDASEILNLLAPQTPDDPAAAEPAPAEPVPAPAEPPPAVTKSSPLRINLPARPAAAPDEAAPSPAIGVAGAAAAKPAKKPSFGLGLLGGLIGALVGSIVYLLIFKYTGLQIKLLAIGVGALAGWFAELLGQGEGSKELGGITAVFVLAGIIGAQYFVALGWWQEEEATRLQEAASAYANAVAEAKEVVKAVPTGSDAEIRAYLAKVVAEEDGEKVSPASIPAEAVKEFHDNQLPEHQQLASGKISKEEYEKKHEIKTTLTKEEKQEEEYSVKGVFLLLLLSKVNLVSLAAAAGVAFKMCTNA
jgi:hypothetical protein